MVVDFLTEVRTAFSFLESARGFRLADETRSDSFGDAIVDFESATLRVRVLRDRGQVFVDISPADGTPAWFDLPLLLSHLGERDAAKVLIAGGQRDAQEAADLLRAHYSEVEAMLGSSRSGDVVRRLTELRLARADRRFGGPDR